MLRLMRALFGRQLPQEEKCLDTNGDEVAVSLEKVGQNWEALANSDPMWAILSHPEKRGNKWEMDEFYQTGRVEIDNLMNYLNSGYPHLEKKAALDFGCGMGRLSLALSRYFEQVIGLDVSETMIEKARNYNSKSNNVKFTLNKTNNIPYEDNSFDLIYSNIVLQHMNINHALQYIVEFIRVIKQDGLIVFQAPSKILSGTGNRFESPVETNSGIVTIDMNTIPIQQIIDTVYRSNGKILEIKADQGAGPKFESFKYFISK